MTKFTNAKKFNKSSIKNIPENKPIVYRLLNNSNKELYTGIAKRNRPQDRILCTQDSDTIHWTTIFGGYGIMKAL